MTGKPSLVGYFDAPADKPSVVEFVAHLEPTNTLRIHPYGLAGSQAVHKIGAEKFDGPGLAVQWVDVEGPLNDTWPPESHRRIFGDLAQVPAPDENFAKRVQVVSRRPAGRRPSAFCAGFARRAFRRTVTDDDLEPFLALFEAGLAQEQTVRAGRPRWSYGHHGLAGIPVPRRKARQARRLCAGQPPLVFLVEQHARRGTAATRRTGRQVGRLTRRMAAAAVPRMCSRRPMLEDAHADATRGRESGRSEGAPTQVERMLEDPKAAAFTENFVGQWLGLRDIDFTEPSHILYPEFDDMLKVSMVRETELFFTEILKNDLSVMNFVASDFTMLNGRLAKHYGIAGVDGWEFQQDAPSARQPSRGRSDDGQRAEGDGQRHEQLAGDARRVGARSHPGHAAPQTSGKRRGPRARHPRRHDDSRTVGQAPADRDVRELPLADRPARFRAGEFRRDRRLARDTTGPAETEKK